MVLVGFQIFAFAMAIKLLQSSKDDRREPVHEDIPVVVDRREVVEMDRRI